MSNYTLYPGCTIQNRIPYLEASAKFVFEKLGVSFNTADFNCCPNPVGLKLFDKKAWLTLAGRNLAVAESQKKDVMSLCNGCFQSMFQADYELKHDPIMKAEVNKALAEINKNYTGAINVKHFVYVLYKDIGIAKIKSMVTKPLSGLKVAVHPGCHYARPSHIVQTDDPKSPIHLKELVKATGATLVENHAETLCCGQLVRNQDEKVANGILKTKIDGALNAGADIIACNCPACFQELDNQQKNLKEEGKDYKVPILYITELLALAMGQNTDQIGLKFHRNRGKEIFDKLGI
jgi:heterodisulfide reductase subunit B